LLDGGAHGVPLWWLRREEERVSIETRNRSAPEKRERKGEKRVKTYVGHDLRPLSVLSSLTGVRLAAETVHGDSEGRVSFHRDRTCER
jgi:hypothetical protein